MRRSERRHETIQLPARKNPARLAVFPVSSSTGIRLGTPRPIWRKHTTYSRWPFVLVFAAAFVLTLIALSHAGPPLSRGARPIALGNGYSAVSGDSYSLFYNPAGLYDIVQKEMAFDFGRAQTPGEDTSADFNVIHAMPYRWKDRNTPIAFGVYAEGPAEGAHIVDLTAGGAMDAPVDRWTKGFIKKAVRMGAAVTIRHQGGETHTDRVGSSSIGLGLSGGFLMPVDRKHQVGFAIRNLFLGDTNPQGGTIIVGGTRKHRDFMDMFLDMSYSRGGVWRFHPGVEWKFARGVVRPRLGWGYRESRGIDTVATGVGFYVSPMQIDFSYLIPTKTLNDDAGQFRASLIYKFGRPQFSEIYYDQALEEASRLDQNVLTLTVKEAELKASLAELEQKRKLAVEEMNNAKARIEAMKDQDLLGERDAMIRDLRARIKELESTVSGYRGRAEAVRKRQSQIRRHMVKAGDTLQSIAREYYGDPNQWKKIYNANADKIDRGLPRVGSSLVIP